MICDRKERTWGNKAPKASYEGRARHVDQKNGCGEVISQSGGLFIPFTSQTKSQDRPATAQPREKRVNKRTGEDNRAVAGIPGGIIVKCWVKTTEQPVKVPDRSVFAVFVQTSYLFKKSF